MTLTDISQVMHCARLTIDGTYKSQRGARLALGLNKKLGGRVSDAHTILTQGIPELVAAVESGHLAFQTGWYIAQHIEPHYQLHLINEIQTNGSFQQSGRTSHGLYKKEVNTHHHTRSQRRAQARVCHAVDNLLDAMLERIDAVAVCTNGMRLAPEAEQGRKWRTTIRRCRLALTKLEQTIDWTKTQTERLALITNQEGDGHNNDPNSSNGEQNR